MKTNFTGLDVPSHYSVLEQALWKDAGLMSDAGRVEWKPDGIRKCCRREPEPEPRATAELRLQPMSLI
ncbi:hypothetical protein NDU88_005786 [Pleurodeles waltl]|uniref:Uncharacterized protein n=1 Tax=Pleurodeles waltl TaxID=8319 RepID=A0AAV7TUX8_PLEWA|nr:hypothetical protein NDU88_005786 [Pleurodeles waltl]